MASDGDGGMEVGAIKIRGVVTDREGIPYLVVSFLGFVNGEDETEGAHVAFVFAPCSIDEVPSSVQESLGVSASSDSEDEDEDEDEDAPFFGGDLPDLTGYDGLQIFSVVPDPASELIYLAVGEGEDLDGADEGDEVELWVFVTSVDPPPEIKRHVDRMFPGAEEVRTDELEVEA